MTENTTADTCATCGKQRGTCFGCAMSDQDRALLAQTEWPTTGEEATADALIRHGARLALAMSAASHELMVKAFAFEMDAPERKPALNAYMDAIASMIGYAQVTDMLVTVQMRSREQADDIARRLWELTEDGGVLHELMFDYLIERGVDAEALFAMEERDAKAKHGAAEVSEESRND